MCVCVQLTNTRPRALARLAFALLLGLTLVGTLLDSRQKRPESPDSAAHRTGHPAPTLAAAGVTADLATANQRRWHYQVYCGSSTTCSELRSSQFDETHSPGLQRNPLAEFVTFCKPSPPIAGATQCAKTAHGEYPIRGCEPLDSGLMNVLYHTIAPN